MILFVVMFSPIANACEWWRADCWAAEGFGIVQTQAMSEARQVQNFAINSANITANEAKWLGNQTVAAYGIASRDVESAAKDVINSIKDALNDAWIHFLVGISRDAFREAAPYAAQLRSAAQDSKEVASALNRIARAILKNQIDESVLQDMKAIKHILRLTRSATSDNSSASDNPSARLGPYCSWGLRVSLGAAAGAEFAGQAEKELTLWSSIDDAKLLLEYADGGGIGAGEGAVVGIDVKLALTPECVSEMHNGGYVGVTMSFGAGDGIEAAVAGKVTWEGLHVGLSGIGHAVPTVSSGLGLGVGEFEGVMVIGGYATTGPVRLNASNPADTATQIQGLSPLYIGWSGSRDDSRTQVGSDFPDGGYAGIVQLGYILTNPDLFFKLNEIAPRPLRPLCIQWSGSHRDSRTVAGNTGSSDCTRESAYSPDTAKASLIPSNGNNTVIGWVFADSLPMTEKLCAAWSGSRNDTITQVGCQFDQSGGYGQSDWIQGYILPPTLVPSEFAKSLNQK